MRRVTNDDKSFQFNLAKMSFGRNSANLKESEGLLIAVLLDLVDAVELVSEELVGLRETIARRG